MHKWNCFSAQNKLKNMVFIICFTFILTPLRAKIPLESGERVLFIGNSYTGFHCNLPSYLEKACEAAEEPISIEAEQVVHYSKELSYIFDETDAVDRIKNGNWTTVIIQGGFNDPVLKKNHSVFKEYVAKFHDVIVESGALPVIWMVWEQKGHNIGWNITKRIHDITYEVADSLNMPVIPIGNIWGDIRRTGKDGYWKDPNDESSVAKAEAFLYRDQVHPTELAAHMNGLAIYSYMMKLSCIGLDFTDCKDEYSDKELEDTVQVRVWNTIKDNLWEENPVGIGQEKTYSEMANTPNIIVSNGKIQIHHVSSCHYRVELFSADGKRIMEWKNQNDRFLLPTLGKGTYIIRLNYGTFTVTRPIVMK